MKKQKKSGVKRGAGKKSLKKKDWQKGEYQRNASFDFILPQQFLMLCRIVETPPRKILSDFMDNLACGSWNRVGRDEVKSRLIDYFIDHGYGQPRYHADQLRNMFRELDAIGHVWPDGASPRLINLTARWKKKYQSYWFNKWLRRSMERETIQSDGHRQRHHGKFNPGK